MIFGLKKLMVRLGKIKKEPIKALSEVNPMLF